MKPMRPGESLLFFGIPTILLWLSTRLAIPYLIENGFLPKVAWFAAGGVGVFVPLFVSALVLARKESGAGQWQELKQRLNIRGLNRGDIVWTAGGLGVIMISTWAILSLGPSAAAMVGGGLEFTAIPPFLQQRTSQQDPIWILLPWLPFFFFNIAGEELFWRGYIFPRQELHHRKTTWIIHGALWFCFHSAFGWSLLILVSPIIFITSYVFQRRHNTIVSAILHGGLNGPAFVAIVLGGS